MLMSTIVAVALGVAPVSQDKQVIAGDYSSQIGRYSQYTDRRGTTHLRGHDGRGMSYDLVMDKHGFVEASVGERVVSFRATPQA